jgi:hypothetical protein
VSHNLDKDMLIVSVPINMNECKVKDYLESHKVVTGTTALISKEKEGTTNVSSEKSGNWVPTKTRFGCRVGRKSGT